MARTSIWLRKFDRDADFIIERAFLFGGEDQRPGRVFDKSLASTRRLRQLYENRQIRHAEPGEVEALRQGSETVTTGVPSARTENVEVVLRPGASIDEVRISVGEHAVAGEYRVITGDEGRTVGEGALLVDPILAARHVGRGRWAIFRGDDRVNDELYDGRAAAEAALAALQG